MSCNCIDYSTLAVSSTAVNLVDNASPALPSQAKGCIITCETDDVRWRADGTAPTTTEGHLIDISIDPKLIFDSWTAGVNWRSVLKKIQFIRVTNDAKLKISWFD